MKNIKKIAIAASAFTCMTLLTFSWSPQGGLSMSVEGAQARVGRPLTPVSVAGVARRQTRRAVYGTGVAGAAAVGTAAAIATAGVVAGAPYYGRAGYYYGGPYASYGYPVQDYAAANGFVCRPGTLVKLDDGLMHRCQ